MPHKLYRAKPGAADSISQYHASSRGAGKSADLWVDMEVAGCFAGHAQATAELTQKSPEKGIKGQRKFLTDFSAHLIRFKV